MTVQITECDITNAHRQLADAMRRAFAEGEREIVARRDLEARRAEAIRDGRIEGKNEAQREAAARAVLGHWFDGVEACEGLARLARHDLDMARLVVDELRLRLRLAELLTRGEVR